MERVGEESVFDVGGDELLVLLLVMEAEGDAAETLFWGVRRFEKTTDGGVDVEAVGEDVVEWRAREGGAELFFRHLAEGVVVAVEEPVEVGVEGFVAGEEVAEDEGLEEPACVGEVPLCGAGVWARLDHEVFGGERSDEVHGGGANGFESFAKGAGRAGGGRCCDGRGWGRHAVSPLIECLMRR